MNQLLRSIKRSICVLVVSIATLVSGCSSLSKYYENFASEKPSSITIKTKQLEEFAEIRNEIKRYHSDYESMRPALSRLVELESDLSFVLEQISEVKREPTYSSASELPIILEDDLSTLDSVIGDESVPVSVRTNQQSKPIKTGAAKPIMVAGVSRSDTKSIDAKFSNTKTSKQLSNSSMDNKFSGAVGKTQQISNELACEDFDASQNGSLAIHIASYSDANKVKLGWSEFKANAKSLVCNKRALVNRVTVNNKVFHSLRFGPFTNRREAEQKCSELKSIQSYCGITSYEGEIL